VEKLRSDYGKSSIINWAIWPYMHGEVILQNYNVLLTLSSLINDSDAVVTLFNDEMLTICKELLKNQRPSYQVLNQVISQQMASVMFPCADSEHSRLGLWQGSSSNILQQVKETLCKRP
jgi:tubulin delta